MARPDGPSSGAATAPRRAAASPAYRPGDAHSLSHRPGANGIQQALKFGAARLVRALGGFAAARWLTRRGFKIMCWHSVSMADEHELFPDLFFSPDVLRERLRHLTSKYRVVSLDEALRQHASGRIEPNQVVLTFDDGLYNFYSAALPVLREFGVPATVYVVSEPMQDGSPAWTLLLRDMVLRTPLRELPSGALPEFPQGAPLAHFSQRKSLAKRLISLFEEHREPPLEFARRVARALHMDLDELLRSRRWGYVTPAEARELAEAGVSVQLHTHTHPLFLGDVEAYAEEVHRCRELVEAATGRPAADFCYPGGFWTRQAWPALERNGVRSAVTTHMGPNFARTPKWALRRVADGNSVPQILFELHVSGLRWLVAALLHPSLWFVPSEKQKLFAETGKGF